MTRAASFFQDMRLDFHHWYCAYIHRGFMWSGGTHKECRKCGRRYRVTL